MILLTDESSDSPSSGSVSPRVTALPPTLKKMLSDKDKEGLTSLQSGGSANKTTQDGGSQNLSVKIWEYLCLIYSCHSVNANK